MKKRKQILVSFILAILISSIQFLIAIQFSTSILWQVKLMHYLVGPGPILGYRNGQPIYEGTPVHMVAGFVGLGLGAIVYWITGYFIMKKWHNHRLQLITTKTSSH